MAIASRRVGIASLLGAPLCLALTGALPRERETSRCSLLPLPISRDTGATWFVATASSDTVLAGPGSTTVSSEPGHWGEGRERPVYGQVVLVDTIAGAASADIREAFARAGASTAIVVPWDYDPACQPVRWSRSAARVDAGLRGSSHGPSVR